MPLDFPPPQPVRRKPSRSRGRRLRTRVRRAIFSSFLLLPLLALLLLRGPPASLVGYRSVTHCASTFQPRPSGASQNHKLPARYVFGDASAPPEDIDGDIVVAHADAYNYAAFFAAARPRSWLIDVGVGDGRRPARVYTETPELGVAVVKDGLESVDAARRNFLATDRFQAQDGAGSYFADWVSDSGPFPELGMERVRGATIVAAAAIEHVDNPDRLVDGLLSLMGACQAEDLIIATVNRPSNASGTAPPRPGANRIREWSISELEAYLRSRGAPLAECRLAFRTNLDRYKNAIPGATNCLISRDTSKRFPRKDQVRDIFPLDVEAYERMQVEKRKLAEAARRKQAQLAAERAFRKTLKYCAGTFKPKTPGNGTNYGIAGEYRSRMPQHLPQNRTTLETRESVVVANADVYSYAARLVAEDAGSWLIDVGSGSGSGFKAARLYQRMKGQKIAVLDTAVNLETTRRSFAATERYGKTKGDGALFQLWTIGNMSFPEIGREKVKGSTILAAGLVHHLGNPDKLVDALLALVHGCGAKNLLLSTAERPNGTSNVGPPVNPYRAREWTKTEFESYLKSRGAEEVSCQMTHASNLDRFRNATAGDLTCLISTSRVETLPKVEDVRDFFPLDREAFAKLEADDAKTLALAKAEAAEAARAKASELLSEAEKAKSDAEAKDLAAEGMKTSAQNAAHEKPVTGLALKSSGEDGKGQASEGQGRVVKKVQPVQQPRGGETGNTKNETSAERQQSAKREKEHQEVKDLSTKPAPAGVGTPAAVEVLTKKSGGAVTSGTQSESKGLVGKQTQAGSGNETKQ